MDVSNERLAGLVAAADNAYQRARELVFDQLPPGAPVDVDRLTPDQVEAFAALIVAETELADYRRHRLEPRGDGELVGAWSFR